MVKYIIILFLLFIILYFLSRKDKKDEGVQIENIRAQLLLSSDDIIKIEKFLLTKEPYLSSDMIKALISRVSELRADKIIDERWQHSMNALEDNHDQKSKLVR